MQSRNPQPIPQPEPLHHTHQLTGLFRRRSAIETVDIKDRTRHASTLYGEVKCRSLQGVERGWGSGMDQNESAPPPNTTSPGENNRQSERQHRQASTPQNHPALSALSSLLSPTCHQPPANSHHSTGRALARLPPLILLWLWLLIHPPLREAEWRYSSGDWRAAPFDAVELIAWRSSRSRPEGNAPGWMPERRNPEPRRGAGRSGRSVFLLTFFRRL
ncbi:hypothetical protein D3C84_688550 [compost metagenome]